MGTGVLLVSGDSFEAFINFSVAKETIDKVVRGDIRIYVLGFVDYIDQFGVRHRSGYARVHEPSLDHRYHYRDVRGVVDEQAFLTRNNLPHITNAGYNYDRERVAGEGTDWEHSLVTPPTP